MSKLICATGMLLMLGSTLSFAASPGVPNLNSTSQDYVDYAETSLPAWFTTALMQNADNTPIDNALSNDGAELGRVLFYDARLSHNNGTSCASCHVQENGFSDSNQFSIGFAGGLTGRHSMGLSNAKFYERQSFFWDERAATLEDQVLGPIQDSVEMGSNLEDLVDELQQTDYYPVLFERAFGDSTVTSDRMAKVMAQFVRSMASYQSEYDQALAAGTGPAGNRTPNFAAVNSIDDPTAASNGHAIFETNCSGCHRGDAQIAVNIENIGLDAVDVDEGAGDGKFKVPSLRNIAVREGYMHDGRFATLEEVIDFYSDEVEDNPNLARPIPVGGFGFTASEKADLLAFLDTLTDQSFLTSELFADPFVTLDGDYNGDGTVDNDDYIAWRDSYGMTSDEVSGPLFADGNFDGVVNAADYTLWRNNFGATWNDLSGIGITAFSQASAIPEPTSWLILTLGILVVLLPDKRHAIRRIHRYSQQ